MNIDKFYIPFGITEQEIRRSEIKGTYDDIGYKMQTIFVNDVIQNSTRRTIKMSPEMAGIVRQLRSMNNRQIVDFVVLKEDQSTYPTALNTLSDVFKNIILENNLLPRLKNADSDMDINRELEEKYSGTPYMGFIRYICRTNEKDFNFVVTMIEEATKQGVADELDKARDMVIENKDFKVNPDFSCRDARIKAYMLYYAHLFKQGKLSATEYDDKAREQDVEKVMDNIKRVNGNFNYLNMEERIAKEFGEKYLSTLNDTEFLSLLLETKLISEEQYSSLTRKYKDINLKEEAHIQENWKRIVKEQEQEK